MQVAAELGFNFINSLLADTVGKEGKKYFPLVLLCSCLFYLEIFLV